MWMTSCTGSVRGGFWGIWKKSVSWELDSEQEGSTFGARWGQTNLCATGVARVLGADGKVIIERLWISLSYVETFNSKVIKGFVHELRSRYVFFVFRDSYVLCIYVMNILCTFHISVYGYGTPIVIIQKPIMQIKSVIIDNIHYINLITFKLITLFFLDLSAEIRMRLIYPCVLKAVKYGIWGVSEK